MSKVIVVSDQSLHTYLAVGVPGAVTGVTYVLKYNGGSLPLEK